MCAFQVIFNIFRQKLIDELFPAVKAKGVGILARVPLASRILTGKFSKETRFADDDHRNYNRDGQVFNEARPLPASPLKRVWSSPISSAGSQTGEVLDGPGGSAVDFSFDAVSCAIPGFKNVAQVEENVAALEAAPFSDEELARLSEF